MREKLGTTTATRVRGRAYDVVAHQQAAMPEYLLAFAPAAADPERDDQEPEAGRREAIALRTLRALGESRTDVEALDLTDERLRHLQDAFSKAAGVSRARADRYAEHDDADGTQPVRQDDQREHRPQEPGRTAVGRPATEWTRCRAPDAVVRTDDARRSHRCAPPTEWMRTGWTVVRIVVRRDEVGAHRMDAHHRASANLNSQVKGLVCPTTVLPCVAASGPRRVGRHGP
ncbi:hypothetical protein [Streptomyces rishiriensis]|uniref:hypothetical protein n=1 Tax=Streptomyces rishiriensis TaxID=68264 RepID=UPI0037D91945